MKAIQKLSYITPVLGLLATAPLSYGATFLELDQTNADSIVIDGNERVPIRIKSGPGDLNWDVGETLSISYQLAANASQDFITNSGAWAIGIGEGSPGSAVAFGVRYATLGTYYWNVEVDPNGGNAGSLGVSLGSSSDRQAIASGTGIPQTTFDLRDLDDAAGFTFDITRSSTLTYDMTATWRNTSDVELHSITTSRTVLAADTVETFGDVVFRANLATGTPDMDLTGLTMEVNAVPEPSSLALLGLGGLALILRRRK